MVQQIAREARSESESLASFLKVNHVENNI